MINTTDKPNTAGERVPARLDTPGATRLVSRRGMLAAMGLGSIGLFAGPSLLGGVPSAEAQTPAAPTPEPRGLGDAGGSPGQPTPYQMQASCELTQDWFLTSDVVIGPDDQVVPFVNPKNNNAVDAMVYAGGTLCHLRRDTAATSGWAYETIDLQGVLSDVTDFAIAANATDVYLLAFGDPGDPNDNPNGDPAWLTTLDGPDTWDSGTTISYDDLQWTPTGPVSIKGGIDPSGVCYFYTSLVDGNTTYLLGWVAGGTGNGVSLYYQQFLTLDTTTESVSDYIILFDNNATAPTGYALVLDSNGDLSVYSEVAYSSQTNDSFSPDPLTDAGASAVTALLWGWATPGSETGTPGYAVQQSSGTALVDENGNYNQLWDTNSVTQNQATVWLQDGLYTVSLLDSNGAVNVVQELSSSGTGTWGPALPLTTIPNGFAGIYAVPTDPSEATMFAVGVDETLSVLSLDESGWTQTQVHQDGAQLLEIDSYRVQATVLDANGSPVGLASVQIGTDRPVGFWQASGNTTATPASPVTMTADSGGQVVFNIPAEELDCAVLTMQALDSDGNPTGTAFTVTADTDVQAFLGGTGSLLGVGPMSSTSLLSAQTAAGGPLFTGLTSLPSDQQASAATSVAGACNQMITVGGTAPPSGPNATQAMLIDVSQPTPVVQTSTNPNAYSIAPAVGAELHLSISHLFDTIGHALRHDAVALKKTVVRWSEDAGSWLVDLAVQIGDEISFFTHLVISDMKDAFHVIGGFFQALGADIVGVVNWIKHNVIELIQDADANARIIQGWYTPFLGTLADAISTIKIDADTFFANLEANANAQITKLAATIENDTFGASAPLPPPTPDTGSHDADLGFKVGADIVTFMRHSPANWLLHKFREHLPLAPHDGGPNFSDLDADLEQVIQDLLNDIEDAKALIESFNTLLWDAVRPFLTDSTKFNETSMGDFFAALEQTTDDALKLIEQVLNTLLDAVNAAAAAIEDLLSYRFQAVPVIGDLLELCGVDTTLSVTRIVSLIASYPTTLINQIIGDGPLFPADNTPPTGNSLTADQALKTQLGSSDRVDGWGVGLNWMSAVVQAIWSFNDLLLDDGAAVRAGGIDGGFKSNSLTTILDIVCPVVITMLQYPSPTTSAGLTQPFWAGTNGQGGGTDLIPWMLFTSFVPPTAEIFYVVGDAKGMAGAEDYNDYGVPTLCAIAGIANTVLSSIYGHDQGVITPDIAFGVLANVSYDVAPLGYPALNELFEDTPAIAKLIVDAIANFGTSIAMSDQAVAAALKPLLVRIPL
jgi:hypothetical protein